MVLLCGMVSVADVVHFKEAVFLGDGDSHGTCWPYQDFPTAFKELPAATKQQQRIPIQTFRAECLSLAPR